MSQVNLDEYADGGAHGGNVSSTHPFRILKPHSQTRIVAFQELSGFFSYDISSSDIERICLRSLSPAFICEQPLPLLKSVHSSDEITVTRQSGLHSKNKKLYLRHSSFFPAIFVFIRTFQLT